MKMKLASELVTGLFLLGMVGVTSATPITFYTDKTVFDTAVPTTLIEDFESITPKDTLLSDFTNNGITYTAIAGVPSPNVMVTSPGYVNFGGGVEQPTTTSILVANGDEDFTASFETPLEAVGFDIYYNGLGPVTVGVYGASGLLDTFNVSPGIPTPDGKGYLGIQSNGEHITSFRFSSIGGAVLNTGIDNISVSPIPEASSVMLMGVVSGFGWFVRRFFLI